MYRINISIRSFFALFLSLSVVLPLIVLGGISLFISSGILRKEITRANNMQVSFFSDRIEQYLDTPESTLRALVRQLTESEIFPEKIRDDILKSYVDSHSFLTGVQVADREGIVQLVYPADTVFAGYDISGHLRFREVRKTGNVFWAPSGMSEQHDTPVASLSLPYGEGVITAFLSLEAITTIFDDSKYTEPGIILYVTDQNGVYIAHTDYNKVLLQEYDSRYIAYKKGELDEASRFEQYEGELYSVYYQIIDSSKWMVALLQPVSAYNKPVRSMMWSFLVLTSFMLVITLAFSSYLRSRLSVPLQKLTSSTGEISRGNYDVMIPEAGIAGVTELSQLGNSIKKMSVEIRSREEALRKARSYLSNVIDSMPSILIGISPGLTITQWNRRAELVTGRKAAEAMGRPLIELMPRLAEEIPIIQKAIDNMEMQMDTSRDTDSTGRKLIEHIVVYPLSSEDIDGAVIRIDDVTEKVQMEEVLIQNEKMLSIGGLAAGMAHEINNPLAGMIQTANVLSGRLGLDRHITANFKAAEEAGIHMDAMKNYMEKRDIPQMIESLNISGKRISGIVNNMLSFVRSSEDNISTHQVNDIIDTSLELAVTDYNLRKKYDFRQIEITKDYCGDLPLVLCEMSKIQQVFFNILQNGAHAMSEASILKPGFTIRTFFEEETEMVVAEIEDNGPGMEESVRKRIFEPFFTTKPVGVGTGLGLSVSYFIITENQKGEMTVESEPGKGARFIIKLPSVR